MKKDVGTPVNTPDVVAAARVVKVVMVASAPTVRTGLLWTAVVVKAEKWHAVVHSGRQ